MVQRFDYLVIGSGIAGMSFALKVANEGKSVALICKPDKKKPTHISRKEVSLP